MAKGREKPVQESVRDGDEIPSNIDGIEERFWQQEYSEDAFVSIQRRDELEQRWVTHGRLAPEDAVPEQVASRFGGGQYRVQLKDKEKSGVFRQIEQHIYKIPGRYRQPETLPGVQPQSTEPTKIDVAPVASNSDDLMQVLKAGIINTLLEMMKSTKEMRGPTGPDPMLLEMIRAQGQTQAKLIELMLSRSDEPKGDSKKEILELLTQMKELIGPQQPVAAVDPNKTLESIVGAIKQLRDVSDEFHPDKGSGDPLLDSLPKFAEVIMEEHQLRKQAAARPATLPPQRISPPIDPTMPLWKQILQREAPRLLKSARAGHDPETIARIAVQFAPPQIKGAITEFFHRELDEVTKQMLEEIPPLAEQPQWMREFVENVQILLFPDEFEDEATEVETERSVTVEDETSGT